MLWLNSHRRFQERLSAYLDGELAPERARALELHLGSCDTCSEELAELRLAKAALAELPDIEVPRSFALTPEAIVSPGATATPPVHVGLRLASGALAAALAVLLVLDVGGIVGAGGGEDSGGRSGERPQAAYDMASSTAEPPAGGEIKAGEGGAGAAAPSPSGEVGQALPEATGSAIAQDGSSETPTPAPAGAASDAAAALGTNGSQDEDNRTFETADSNEDSDDGLSALSVTEIVLAALLGASVVGSIAAGYAGRRRG